MPLRPRPEDGEGDEARAAVSPLTQGQTDEVKRLAREEVYRGWEEVGVDTRTFTGRQDHARLLVWLRERRTKIEAGTSKFWTALVGAGVSASIAAFVAYVTGRHP